MSAGRPARPGRPAAWAVALGVAAVSVALIACGGGEPEEPTPPPAAPNLAGARVMLLPVRAPAPARLDAELAYWLGERASATDWVLPEELQRAADRMPAWRLRLTSLPRGVVDVGGGDQRVQDPLYGALRQLGAVVHADYAVVPLTVAERTDSAGTALTMAAALVDIRGGRVLWLHTAAGDRNTVPGRAVASVAEAVARSLVP